MFQCEICGRIESRRDEVAEVFHVDGRYIPVEHIPATVCVHCGEKTFDAETAENIRRRLHGEGKPLRSVEMEVFAY